jgi:hypothetical protein
MPKTVWETRIHALLLAVCFGLPLAFEMHPDHAALAAVFAVTVAVWISVVRSDDPFLSTGRVTALAGLLLANAVAYSLSDVPTAPPLLSVPSMVVALIYLAILIGVVLKACRRVADIDLEYFRYSLPSKRLTVDLGRRTGRLDQTQAALRLQLFVKEGLQFRRLSRVCRLLVMQSWAGLALYVLFGMNEPWNLLVFLATSLLVSASATSIASRATLHPGQPATPEEYLDDSFQEEEEDDEIEEYRPRRRHQRS